jgi:hypothetical protein
MEEAEVLDQVVVVMAEEEVVGEVVAMEEEVRLLAMFDRFSQQTNHNSHFLRLYTYD